MTKEHTYPRLRWPVELSFEKHNGQKILLLSCPLGISPEPLPLIASIAPILARFDGNQSVDDIVSSYSQHGVSHEMLKAIIELLDEKLFLDTPHFYQAKELACAEFEAAPLRAAALAGLGYPADPKALAYELDRYMELATLEITEKKISALITPHIDYRRGGSCYGKTYAQLKNQKHDLYVIFGTAHQYEAGLFHLIDKDFATPFGPALVDHHFVSKIVQKFGNKRAFKGQFLHKKEHSIELQLPFLMHLQPESKICPILVGSFHEMIAKEQSTEAQNIFRDFTAAFSESLKECIQNGKSICLVAAVDFAHVGRTFGDTESLTNESMNRVKDRDALLLATLEGLDQEKLLSHIAEDQDARRVCGFPSLYTLVTLLNELKLNLIFKVFDYQQSVDFERDCAVTFAGAAYYES